MVKIYMLAALFSVITWNAPGTPTPDQLGAFLRPISYGYGEKMRMDQPPVTMGTMDCSGFIAVVCTKIFGPKLAVLNHTWSQRQPWVIARLLNAPLTHYASRADLSRAWHKRRPVHAVMSFDYFDQGKRAHHIMLLTKNKTGRPVIWHCSKSGLGVNHMPLPALHDYLTLHHAQNFLVVDITRPLTAACPAVTGLPKRAASHHTGQEFFANLMPPLSISRPQLTFKELIHL